MFHHTGEQLDFVIHPPRTRNYTIQTFGDIDTVMVLFEDADDELQYRTADDDSGEDYNAKLVYASTANLYVNTKVIIVATVK